MECDPTRVSPECRHVVPGCTWRIATALLPVILLLGACSVPDGALRLRVENASATDLRDVEVRAGGVAAQIGPVTRGESRRSRLVPTRDSSIVVRFRIDGGSETLTCEVDTYVTTGPQSAPIRLVIRDPQWSGIDLER